MLVQITRVRTASFVSSAIPPKPLPQLHVFQRIHVRKRTATDIDDAQMDNVPRLTVMVSFVLFGLLQFTLMHVCTLHFKALNALH